MWCPQCGGSNDDSARFCNQCGLDFAKYREQWQSPETRGAQPEATGWQQADQQTYQQPSQQQFPYQPPYQQQYPPPYQAQQYRPMSSYGAIPRVPSYLGWAIAVLVLCFWPTAIPAVVYASQVGDKLAVGDVAGAQESSRKAKMWCWISFGIALAGVVLVIIVVIIAFATAGSSVIY